MSDFRKNLHIAYKKKLLGIIKIYSLDMFLDIPNFTLDPDKWITEWIDKNCLPSGDFDLEQAIKEIKEWKNG